MVGDCGRCGHSIAYHMPFVGCVKCDCEEFVVRLARKLMRMFR